MKIYWKILISYLCVCMVPLLLSLFTCLKLEQNVRETILRDQSRMIDDVWNNLNATIQASYEAERMIAEDSVLKDLAERGEISNVNLSNLKTGKVKAIRFSTLGAICRELKCQPGDILEYTEDETEEETKEN